MPAGDRPGPPGDHAAPLSGDGFTTPLSGDGFTTPLSGNGSPAPLSGTGSPAPLSGDEFAALMAPLGPFGAAPGLAAGVSGGPHSLALALLAQVWAAARGGGLLALVADHGLRPESGAEADRVAGLLAARGIAARVLRLGLRPGGPGMQARARAARLSALLDAAEAAGTPWLLLGHHRGDQAETLLHRAAAGSGPAGMAAMAALRPASAALVLRPLLGVAPARLEAVVAAAGLDPVRDPSNLDPRFARIRLRQALADPAGTGPEVAALAAAAGAFARRRARQEAAVAARLASACVLHPAGWAEIDPAALGRDAVAEAALAALLRAIGGAADFAPAPGRVAGLLRAGGGTLGGAWLQPAGPRWRLLREPAGAARAAGVPAVRGALWDGRFRMIGPGAPGFVIGALADGEAARLRQGAEAARLRRGVGMPAAVLAGLPAIRGPGQGAACPGQPEGREMPVGAHSALAAVPALLYPDRQTAARFALAFAPATGPVS